MYLNFYYFSTLTIFWLNCHISENHMVLSSPVAISPVKTYSTFPIDELVHFEVKFDEPQAITMKGVETTETVSKVKVETTTPYPGSNVVKAIAAVPEFIRKQFVDLLNSLAINVQELPGVKGVVQAAENAGRPQVGDNLIKAANAATASESTEKSATTSSSKNKGSSNEEEEEEEHESDN